MKNGVRKTIVAAALFVLAAVFACLACAAWGVFSIRDIIDYIENGAMALRVLMGVLFFILACGAIYTLVCAMKIGRQPSNDEMNLLANGGGGSSYISSEAVSGMVTRLLKKNKQIKSANCSVTPVEEGIVVDTKLVTFTGGDLSRLCTDIQSAVKSEIENTVGIPVRNVSVSIVQTVENANAPVEKRVN